MTLLNMCIFQLSCSSNFISKWFRKCPLTRLSPDPLQYHSQIFPFFQPCYIPPFHYTVHCGQQYPSTPWSIFYMHTLNFIVFHVIIFSKCKLLTHFNKYCICSMHLGHSCNLPLNTFRNSCAVIQCNNAKVIMSKVTLHFLRETVQIITVSKMWNTGI